MVVPYVSGNSQFAKSLPSIKYIISFYSCLMFMIAVCPKIFIYPLHTASRYGWNNIAQKLIKHGANVNKIDYKGAAPLICAICSDQRKTVELLLANGANPNQQKDSAIPLLSACYSRDIGIVELLLQRGAKINVPIKDGYTILHLICRSGSPNMIKLLIKHGANINAKTSDTGQTPLHEACFFNQMQSVQVLVEHGANINEPDKQGTTALHIAYKAHNAPLVAYLLMLGANINTKTIATIL